MSAARDAGREKESRPPPVTRMLGDWIAGLRFDKIPASSIRHAKRCLLDAVGCGLYGGQQEWGRIAAAVARDFSGGGPASLWGHGDSAGPADAAMVNGTAVHGFEIDDIHVESMFHPGAVTIPAVLAVAEARGRSGEDVLTAIVAGYEIGIRMGIAGGLGHKMKGYHVTATNGCFAAAAAVANLIGLDGEAATDALGIAATEASGLYSARKGAMTKRFHGGMAAKNGVVAGYLAERGFTGARDAIETPFGGYLSTMSDNADLSLPARDLGRRWHIDETGFKAYASCASTHTTIDCLDTLMDQGLAADTLDRLTIHMSKAGFTNVGWDYQPLGVVGMQMNGRFVAATKLLEGEVFVDQFTESRIADPDTMALIDRIDIVHDPAIDALGLSKRHTVHVEAETRDGRTLTASREQRTGSAEHPLSDRDLMTKFRHTAGAVLKGSAVDALIAEIDGMENARDMSGLSALLIGADSATVCASGVGNA